MHIEMQREIHSSKQVIQQQHECIEELQVQAAAFGGKLPPKTCLASVALAQPSSKSDEGKKPAIYIENFTTWEQLAEAVNCDASEAGLPLRAHDRLLAVARLASEQERSHFAQMLSEFCESEPKALDCVEWIPPRLLNSALAQLSFSISRLADTNVADEPVVETIQGCKFVSVKNLGNKSERWVFQLPDQKNIPISERYQFEIERF